MSQILSKLFPLQQLDLEIFNVSQRLEALPKDLASYQRRVEAARTKVAQAKERLKLKKLDVQKIDSEIKAREEQIRKLEQDGLKARKNEEYLTIQKLISGVRRDIQVLEDKWMALDALVEAEAKVVAEDEKDLGRAEQLLQQEQGRIEKEIEGQKRTLAELEQRRKGLVEGIDEEVLQLYERLQGTKALQGRAMSKVVRQEALGETKSKRAKRESEKAEDGIGLADYRYSCENCQAEVTLHKVNILMIGRDVVVCPGCSRILYLEEAQPRPA